MTTRRFLITGLLLLATAATFAANSPSDKPGRTEQAGVWHEIGPFRPSNGKIAFSEAFAPEQGVDLDKPCGSMRWTARPEYADGKSHSLRATNNTAVYLYRTIRADSARTIDGYFGHDDGIVVWLNNQKVLSLEKSGSLTGGTAAKLELKEGENRLLIKIYNRGGRCGFYFSLVPPDPTAPAAAPAPGAAAPRAGKRDDKKAKNNKPAAKAAKPKAVYAGEAAPPPTVEFAPLRRAIQDLTATFGPRYPKGPEYLRRLEELERKAAGGPEQVAVAFGSLRQEALLANPLLDFDKLLVVRRPAKSPKLGLPQNWQGNCALGKNGFDDEIAVLSPVSPQGRLTTLYKREGKFVGDVDLDFDAGKMMFSSTGDNGRWQIFEIGADGKNLRQITTGLIAEADNYDPCYLPSGKVIFASTACFHGVPCVGGKTQVANLFLADADGQNVRQLCFDQDHNWCPTVLPSGRVMYTRWEYSDTPHYFTRVLFSMNPDGTQQMEYYGSNSYWPNSLFYARPIPGDSSKFVGVISGHHGVPRMGELVLFDAAKGRREADGVIQRIPGYGQPVEPRIADGLVNGSWPKFLHPYPLSDKYFLVSCQMTSKGRWGLYLADVFDNLLLLREEADHVIFEPVPFRKTPRPPVIPNRVDPTRKDALVYITDIYSGPGLRGVPRGTVKALRLSEFHYAYNNTGGHAIVGQEGPWDVRRILGTVPIQEDGSVFFRVPANTPICLQPLDEQGAAVQVMRSWLTAMPGEVLSCIGCHESQNQGAPVKATLAAYAEPAEIAPWRGQARGFSFIREVQPVLDRYCVGCHDGQKRADGRTVPDFARKDKPGSSGFTSSYLALHPYVRRPGPESDYHLQVPMDWHVSTSPLVRMLRRGHHNVQLDAEAWDRLFTWIDLNCPDRGSWQECRPLSGDVHDRRLAMRTKYAGISEDPEQVASPVQPPAFVKPAPQAQPPAPQIKAASWPFDAAQARQRQAAAGTAALSVDLGEGLKLEMVLVPAGEFVMGDPAGWADEQPPCRVRIDKPFYMGKLEITNAQYALFDASHDSRFIDQQHKDHNSPGYPANGPTQPVIRISWRQAMAYCRWLSERTGKTFVLPTEAQWAWACRAGTDTPMSYGRIDADFSRLANLADASIRLLAVKGVNPQPVSNPSPFQAFLPREDRWNDGEKITAAVGKYAPNAFGLCDMHGNVWEWTQSLYRPYPYRDSDGREDAQGNGLRVARGGSWADKPAWARSAARLAYQPWQAVHDVGFRVVMIPADHKVAAK